MQNNKRSLELNGKHLTINKIAALAYQDIQVKITNNPSVLNKLAKSCQIIQQAIAAKKSVYGVNTNFGGMANKRITETDISQLQTNLIWGLKAAAGKPIPVPLIRAGMLLRINSLLRGASGIRLEIIERYCRFLNNNITPVVHEYGSIGASGDLIPLSYVAGTVLGVSKDYQAIYKNKKINARQALKILNLPLLKLQPKEGLALVNGTSMSTGIAAICLNSTEKLFKLSLYLHAFYIQALQGSSRPFHPFVHRQKPHEGQQLVAKHMRNLLRGSKLIHNELNINKAKLLQDRYSLRCLPQYLGPVLEGLQTIKAQIEVEANSASDNPLIDTDTQNIFHSGNFLAEYIGINMDQLRAYIGLIAKHLDTQVALLMAPEFNDGLPASLVGDTNNNVQFGLKGLQISMNSIMPILLHLGNGIAHLYATHSEQYNQNINSQSYAAANLAWRSVEIFSRYLAMALLVAVQSVDLRAYAKAQHYDARKLISPRLVELYEIVYAIVGKKKSVDKPFIFSNVEQALDEYIYKITMDIMHPHGKIAEVLDGN